MAKGKKNLIGSWAFLIGVILAVILGLLSSTLSTTFIYILVALGLIVGLLNITSEESSPFLISGAVLIIASFFGQSVLARVPEINGVLQALLALFVPSTLIVAIKNVFNLARS